MSLYRTVDGDMVDAIVARHYGGAQMTVAVYEANPGLAARGPVLPKGVLIVLPEALPPRPAEPIRLWE